MGGGGRLGGGKTRRGAAEAIPKTDAGARAGAAPLTPPLRLQAWPVLSKANRSRAVAAVGVLEFR